MVAGPESTVSGKAHGRGQVAADGEGASQGCGWDVKADCRVMAAR